MLYFIYLNFKILKRIIFTCFIFLLTGHISYSQPGISEEGKKNNYIRICTDPETYVKFFKEAKLKNNLVELLKSIPLSLENDGIIVKLKPEAKNIRIGSMYFAIEKTIFWDHFEGKDQKYWIDIVKFVDWETCESKYNKYQIGQKSIGGYFAGGWSFMTDEAKNGLDAINILIKRDKYIFNFGISIPFIINLKNNVNEKIECQYIDKSIDTLLKVLEKVARVIAERENENGINLDYPDENTIRLSRLENFARLWSEVKYNFVFRDKLKEIDWEHLLGKYLLKIDSVKNYYDYIKILRECIALLKDGHTVAFSKNMLMLFNIPGIEISPIGGKPIVISIGKTAELKASQIKIGMELIKINNRPVQEVLQKDIFPYISSSTPQDKEIKGYNEMLESIPGSYISLSFLENSGKELNVSLKCNALNRLDSNPWIKTPLPIEYKKIDKNIAYVSINTFNSNYIVKEFDKILDTILEAKGLIIDVRKNGGGNSGYGDEIIARLIDKKCDRTLKWKTRLYKPAFNAWGEKEEWYEGFEEVIEPYGNKQFLGPIVVLIGPKTFSAAEDFLVPLKASGRAKLVGMPTGGSTGQPLRVSLTDAVALICTKWDYFPDGTEFVGVGIQPDVKIEPIVKDIIEGRDAVLEKGVQLIKQMMK